MDNYYLQRFSKWIFWVYNSIGQLYAGEYMASQKNNIPQFDYFIHLKEPFLRDLFSTWSLYDQIESHQIDFIKPNLDTYKNTVQNELIKRQFLSDYEKQYNILYNSKQSPNSIINSSLQLKEDNPFASIIEKHKGKVIYVDIWATWCGPCLDGMRNSLKLRDKLAGRDVVFIYICTNSPSEKVWESLVAANKIEGENYFLSYSQSKVLNNIFNIRTIPRYILVDKSGEVVNKDAGRPGEAVTFNKIQELLN